MVKKTNKAPVEFTEVTTAKADLTPAKSVSQWKKDETFIGYFTAVKSIKTPSNPEAKLYTFMVSDEYGNKSDEIQIFWGSTGLDPLMAKQPVFQLCRLTCYGKKVNPKTGRTFIDFKLKTAPLFLTSSEVVAVNELASKVNVDTEEFVVDWAD